VGKIKKLGVVFQRLAVLGGDSCKRAENIAMTLLGSVS